MNVFTQLQQSVIARLTEVDTTIPLLVPVVGQIAWVTEDKGDFANIIARATAQLGIVGIVMTPGGGKLFKVGVFPISFDCPIEIQTQENVTVNRSAAGTQIPSLDLMQFIMQRLHLWSPTGQRITRIELNEVPYRLVTEHPLLVYNTLLTAKVTIPAPLTT